MQHVLTLRKTIFFLSLALVIIGCETSNNHVANADFRLSAEAVPEGILLIFSNFPSDATHLWINVSSWDSTEVPENQHSIISSHASITDTNVRGWIDSTQQLDKIKQNGEVIFPVVQSGIKYFISATLYNKREFNLFTGINGGNFQPRSAYTWFIANNGILNRDDAKLEVNDTHSVVTISCEPVFSSEIVFADQKYSFDVSILVDDNRSMGFGDHHFPDGLSPDGLTWVFEPQMTDDIRKDNPDGWLEIGSYYSAWITVYVNIIYDDIEWSVEIAKSDVFPFSL